MRVLLILISFIILSCGKEQMTPEDLIRFVQSEDSGMLKEAKVGESRMMIQYLPKKYWEAKCVIEQKEYGGAQDSFASFKVYFTNPDKTQSLSRYTASNKADYLDRLQYLDGDARYDFLFKQANDTSLAVLYHYERTYDLVPFDCVNLNFPLSGTPNSEFHLEYHDNMFTLGIQKWLFDSKSLSRIENIELVEK